MNGGIERVLSIIASELADNWDYDVTIVSIYRTLKTPNIPCVVTDFSVIPLISPHLG